MREPIRVLHVLPDLRIGGGQMVVLDAIACGDRDAFETHIATVGPTDELGDRFRALGIEPVDCTGSHPLVTLRALVAGVRATGADLLHVHSPVDRKYGHAAAFLTRRPVVSHLHSPWDHRGHRAPEGASIPVRSFKQVKSAGRDWLERRVVREYLAVSDPVAAFFERRGLGPVTLVENGIDRNRIHTDPGAVARARDVIGAGDRPLVMSVARIDVGKGQLALVEALATSNDPRWALVLVGDGPLAADIRAAATDRGVADRLVMLGNRHDVPDLLAAADVWVLASETEGHPVSVMEAMAAGRAICVYDLPTLREMLDDGRAAVIVGHHPAELTRAIDDLLGEPSRRAALGAAAAARAEARYDAARMAAGIEAAYRRALT